MSGSNGKPGSFRALQKHQGGSIQLNERTSQRFLTCIQKGLAKLGPDNRKNVKEGLPSELPLAFWICGSSQEIQKHRSFKGA